MTSGETHGPPVIRPTAIQTLICSSCVSICLTSITKKWRQRLSPVNETLLQYIIVMYRHVRFVSLRIQLGKYDSNKLELFPSTSNSINFVRTEIPSKKLQKPLYLFSALAWVLYLMVFSDLWCNYSMLHYFTPNQINEDNLDVVYGLAFAGFWFFCVIS